LRFDRRDGRSPVSTLREFDRIPKLLENAFMDVRFWFVDDNRGIFRRD
jgi:hypothetical protein